MVMLVIGRSLRRRARRSLLFIVLSFLNRDLSRGNEADRLRVKNIDDFQQSPVVGHADDGLALFTPNNFSRDQANEGIKEDLARCFEANAMLAKV